MNSAEPGAGFNGAQILRGLISRHVPTSKIDPNPRNLVLSYAGRVTLRGARNFRAPLNPAPVFHIAEGGLAAAQEALQGAAGGEGQVGPLDLPDLGGEAAGHDRGWIGEKAHAVRAGHSAASKVIN